ncbi:Cofilin [Acropora cervicornis]|uniref:Cofilin n=1 Tax=Acropora cervicornis TaxID=6130 RepID=A0AAD9QT92_ACRCE|nr:Cofilin [Acropora cervicornis]
MGMITELKAMTHKKIHYFPHLHTGVEKANRVDRFVLVDDKCKFLVLKIVSNRRRVASSGVTVSEDCIQRFNEMKLNHKHSFLIMSVKGQKQVEVDELGKQNTPEDNNEETFNTMRKKVLEQNEPKYIVFDFLCSDDCNVKKKMLHSSSEDAIKKAVTGVQIKIQANDSGELDYQTILKDIKRSGK